MSCGNRFQCGITRFQKHSFTPDRPSNPELHDENQKRLNDLIRAREEIDNHFFKPITSAEPIVSQQINTRSVDCLLEESITVDDIEMANPSNTVFTPWVVPSATKSTN